VCNPHAASRRPPGGPRRRLAAALSPACALLALLGPAAARADEPAAAPAAEAKATEELRALSRRIENTGRLLGSLEFGRGFRFNNPYRLATELGKDAQSVSLTAAYADLGAAFVYGPPNGLQHGVAMHGSFSMMGIFEFDLNVSYQLAYRGSQPFLVYGRLGPTFSYNAADVPNVGGEVGAGFAWFLTGRIAVASELVFDLFLGAPTRQVAVVWYPILSGQLGLLVEFEDP
jgi:hypothetical protein